MSPLNRKDSVPTAIPDASQSPVLLLEPGVRVKRRGRKRTRFAMPRQSARSVRSLWESASEEERSRAHQSSMAILELWLGKKTKYELAQELSLSPLRVWQLSQSALSGMLAGLLKQPRTRGRPEEMPRDPENDPRALKARIKKLESQLELTEDLVRVLKDLPWNRGADFEGIEEFLKTRRARAERKPRADGAKRPRAKDRGVAPEPKTPEG